MSKPPWVGVGLDKPKPPAADGGGERVLESLNATLHKFRAAIHVGDRVKDRHSGRLGTCLFVGPADFAKGKEVCGLRLDKARADAAKADDGPGLARIRRRHAAKSELLPLTA